MAKITPIDVVKGISGNDGNRAIDNFATNKRCNKSSPTRDATRVLQQENQQEFSNKESNKSSPICDSTRAPTGKNEEKGVELLQKS